MSARRIFSILLSVLTASVFVACSQSDSSSGVQVVPGPTTEISATPSVAPNVSSPEASAVASAPKVEDKPVAKPTPKGNEPEVKKPEVKKPDGVASTPKETVSPSRSPEKPAEAASAPKELPSVAKPEPKPAPIPAPTSVQKSQGATVPEKMEFATDEGDVTFSHKQHAEKAGDCTVCHDVLFPKDKSQPLKFKGGMHKPAIANKSSCAACHVPGGKAFPVAKNCDKCHKE